MIPKKYYRFFEDESFKTRFFSNVKEQLGMVDEISVLDIVDYIDENFVSLQQNDGNNVEYIAAVLREKLDEERERISNHVEILNSKLREQESFYGRQDELYEIKQCLNSQGYAVLSGEPGVGKSEIALYYALNSNANESGEKKYETIIWIRFRESLKETFRDILRYNSNDTYLAGKPNAFSIAVSSLNNIGKKALVIIERMNIDFRNDIDLSEEIKRFRFDLIITTRSRVSGSIYVPYLPWKYMKRIDRQIRNINYDNSTEQENIVYNPLSTMIYCLNTSNSNYYKYEIKGSSKYGNQKLTTRAWMNRLYGFYNMPDNERKVLMFLSIFTDKIYHFRFVTTVLPICDKVMMDRLVSLGWICIYDNSAKTYVNAFPWWKYYHDYPNSISIDEFDGMCLRVESILNQHKGEEGVNTDIYYCGYLALKICGNDLKWYFLRKEIANRIYLTNQSFSLQIMMSIGSGAEMAFDIANNYTIESNKAIESAHPTLKQYLEVWFSKNIDSKIEYLSTYIADKLSNDIFLINQWAEKFLECYILHTFYNHKEYEICIRHTIEGYRSEKTLIDLTKCNEGDFSAVIQDIKYAIEPQSSPIYKTLRNYCEKNSLDFPDKKIIKLVAKIKDLVPMIVLVEKLNDIICMSQPKSLTQAQLSEVEGSIRKYLNSPNNTHALLFCNAMATLYIILGIPDSAKSMLDQSQNYITVSENELMYSITASLVRTKIELFRCWGQADKDITNDEIMKNIDVISKEFDSLDPIHRLLGRCNFTAMYLCYYLTLIILKYVYGLIPKAISFGNNTRSLVKNALKYANPHFSLVIYLMSELSLWQKKMKHKPAGASSPCRSSYSFVFTRITENP